MATASPPRRARPSVWLFGVTILLAPGMAAAQPSALALHERIDAAIAERLDGPPAPRSSDAEFLRRIYLDLTGSIPTVEEAEAFLDDESSDKRERLIDRLLEGPGYARRMQYVFDVMWLERRGDEHVPSAAWQAYLHQSFAENKPYDRLAAEVLSADGSQPDLRPAARFFLDREVDPNLLTRDVGRLFLGRDMQCAQCHDHPLIAGYLQEHYYGLMAFFSRSSLFADKKTKQSVIAEKADGEVSFKSVFDPESPARTTPPRLIDGPAIEDVTFPKGEEYYVAPAKDVRSVPKYSRLAQLSVQATSGQSPDFNRNIVNRLWALMMGRGLVEPVDLHHEDNPPSHPELLELLADEFVAMKFDIRAFLRELALSQTYQRSSTVPEGMTDEQAAPERFAVAPLKPLSPEQLAWSTMEATGLARPLREAELARVEADPRLAQILSADEARERLKAEFLERAVYEKLKGNISAFVGLFGGSAGEPEQDFQATVQQALFLANGSVVNEWLRAGPASLPARLSEIEEAEPLAEALYLSVLSRRPSEEETAAVAAYLEQRKPDRQAAIEEMTWALLTSTEFRFNH